MVSLFAACRDLADAPSDDAVRQALVKCLPKRPRTLEEWLEPALAGRQLPKALFARGREVAIDCGKKPQRNQTKSGRRKTRGRRQRPVKLRDFQRQAAGRYAFTWTVKQQSMSFHVVVAYKSYRHQKTGSRRAKKLLYAVWRVRGIPMEIRELYRRRFGIESSYRQLGLARIRTCTTDPVLRLFFVLVALVLRNVWVWLHFTYFAKRRGGELQLRLECLRFRRMLNWIEQVITNLLHDGSEYVTQVPAP